MAFTDAFLAALVVALASTPLLRRVALRFGAVDRPGARSTHVRDVPYLGGLAIFLACAAGLGVLLLRGGGAMHQEQLRGVLYGGLIVVIAGVADDLGQLWARFAPWLSDREGRGVRPAVKILAQVLGATVLFTHGVRIVDMQNPFAHYDYIEFGWAAYPLTVLWVVAVSNAVNLVDGLDGLAAGLSSIAAATLLVVAWISGMWLAALFSAVLLGACLGFLPWNFHPARIFMGDAGALFLGFALGAVSVIGPLKSPTLVALAVPALALGLPVFDTALAILRRWRKGQGVAAADHAHVHHRLLDLGFSHRDAVLALYVVSGWLGVSALAVARVGPLLGGAIVAFVVLSVGLAARWAGMTGGRREQRPRADGDSGPATLPLAAPPPPPL